MKFLISDYSSDHSTEPLYLNTIFNAIGCTSTISPYNLSAFDAFDLTNPDVFITHYSKITRDVVYYLKDRPEIDLIVNITGLSQDNLNEIESVLYNNRIKPLFFFINTYDHPLKSNKTNINVILHGADILFGEIKKIFSIEYGIFVNKESNMNPVGTTYHYLSTHKELEKTADIVMPTHKLTHFYPSYKHIVFRYFDNILPQAFFDSAYYGKCVFYDIQDRSILDTHLQKLFGESGLCTNEQNGNVSDKIKLKHTCLHRAKSFLSQLPCKEYTDKLQSIIEEQLK